MKYLKPKTIKLTRLLNITLLFSTTLFLNHPAQAKAESFSQWIAGGFPNESQMNQVIWEAGHLQRGFIDTREFNAIALSHEKRD